MALFGSPGSSSPFAAFGGSRGILSPDDPNSGGITGTYPRPASGGMFGGGLSPSQKTAYVFAALRDAVKSFSGQDSDYASQQLQQSQSQSVMQARQAIVAGLTSSDPQARAKAYQLAPIYGVNPEPFQKQAAASGLPTLSRNLQPYSSVNVTPEITAPGQLQQRQAAGDYALGSTTPSASEALATTAPLFPETAQQFAPDIFKAALKGPDNTPHTGVNPATGKQGQYVLKNGAPQWLDVGVLPEAPKTRTLQRGMQSVEQQFNPVTGQFEDIPGASGPKFKPADASPIDPKAVDLGVNYFMANGGKFPPTARNPRFQAAIMAAASDRMEAQGLTMDDLVRKGQDLHAGGQTVVAFDKGKQGDTVRSLNVAVAHLKTLSDLGVALQNGDVRLLNAARQRWQEETGSPAPTNYDAAKAIVADEVAKGVIGGQTAQSDRETLAASLRRERSPQAIEGAINTFQELLGGQLRGLRQQYKSSTKRDDFNDKLFPSTLAILDKPKKALPPTPQSLPRNAAAPKTIRFEDLP